ncbi:MAG: hypothetical protein HFF04_02345 [Oscillospiraceae bacterium]|jgi:hypothetical protein|nr:hypothetical protein [Oscillospiraceae bacterium]
MKFEKKANVNGIFIPRFTLDLCKFKGNEDLELHTLPGAMVVTRDRMTAGEIVETVEALTSISTYLIKYLIRSCGPCEECCEDGCPCEEGYIKAPDSILEESGLAPGAKLCAEVNPEDNSFTVRKADYRYDLRDVPEGLLTLLRKNGICLGELEEKLMTEDIIYG